jgi:isopropylmalate/homocitrate/citramalate synthase
MGIKETGILVSCSDYHIFKKLKMTRKQALEHYMSIVKAAFDEGIIPRCHFEDITRADFYGFVVPFINELHELSLQYNMPVKIRACDTLGYGIPFSEAALPRSVPGIIYGIKKHSSIPSEQIEWHGHMTSIKPFQTQVVHGFTAQARLTAHS